MTSARAGLRGRGPAGAGRAQPRCAGDSADTEQRAGRARCAKSAGRAPYCRANGFWRSRCGKCASSWSIRSTLHSTSPTRTRLSTCCSKFATPKMAAENQRGGRGIPRALVAGNHGRLLQRPQSHAADLWLCPIATAACRSRISRNASRSRNSRRQDLKDLGPDGASAREIWKDWMHMRRLSPFDWRRSR